MKSYIVYSLIKEKVNSVLGKDNQVMEVGKEFLPELNNIVSGIIDDAIVRAKAEGKQRLIPKYLPVINRPVAVVKEQTKETLEKIEVVPEQKSEAEQSKAVIEIVQECNKDIQV